MSSGGVSGLARRPRKDEAKAAPELPAAA